MPRLPLLQLLATRPLLCDGAMGTQLIAAGLTSGSCGEKWNLDRPDVIQAIHRRYRDAGCQLVTTNTFGGTSFTLARHGLDGQVAELNRAGAQVARQGAGDDAYVLGDIGPFGDFIEPVGDYTPAQVTEMFTRQAVALAEGGVDAFIVETMVDPVEMSLAIKAAKSATGLPVIATYAFGLAGEQFRTIMGADPQQAMKAAIDAGADVVGANCGTGLSLEQYTKLAGELVKAAGKTPVILQPNAGAPRNEGDKLIYDATPAHMAQIVPVLLQAGVKIIGGCCGTTPDHLRAMGSAIKA